MLTDSGILYMKLGQTQLAFERLSSALALEPTHYKALLGIGCITQVKYFNEFCTKTYAIVYKLVGTSAYKMKTKFFLVKLNNLIIAINILF